MAVHISAPNGALIPLANIVFESVRECVAAESEDEVLAKRLQEAQHGFLLELAELSPAQREQFAVGVQRLKEQAAEREGVHPGLLEHLEKVRQFVLTEGVHT